MANADFSTRAAQAGLRRDPSTGALSTPIYQTATFAHPAFGQSTGYDYSRTANPTRSAVEAAIADLEGGHRAFGFSTGLAATTALAMLFSSGDHIVASEDMYGGTFRLFESVFGRFGLATSYVDSTDPAAVEAAVQPGRTKALFVETPSNPMMQITDLAACAAIARRHGLLLIVDNTFMSPYFQRPIELGADLVLHSGTKFLGGHNDTLSGFVVARTPELSERVFYLLNASGAVLAPFDSWLILRGVKTLAVRMERQQETARRIVDWLAAHPRVTAVHYPERGDAASARTHAAQASGGGSMISFRLDSAALAKTMLGKVRIISFAESLGGVETLMTHPLSQTHKDIPQATKDRLGLGEDLLRLSVGLESPRDLIADLAQSMEA